MVMTRTVEKEWPWHKNHGEGMVMTQEQRRRNGHEKNSGEGMAMTRTTWVVLLSMTPDQNQVLLHKMLVTQSVERGHWARYDSLVTACACKVLGVLFFFFSFFLFLSFLEIATTKQILHLAVTRENKYTHSHTAINLKCASSQLMQKSWAVFLRYTWCRLTTILDSSYTT